MPSCMILSVMRRTRSQVWLPHRKTHGAFMRSLHLDGRARLSNEWAPSGGFAVSDNEGTRLGAGLNLVGMLGTNVVTITCVDAHGKLIRAGFIRQVRAVG